MSLAPGAGEGLAARRRQECADPGSILAKRGDDVGSNELRGALEAIVMRNSRLDLRAVRDDHRLAADLGFDSLAFLLAVGDLESNLKVSFPLERIDDLRNLTFRDLVQVVSEQRPQFAVEG